MSVAARGVRCAITRVRLLHHLFEPGWPSSSSFFCCLTHFTGTGGVAGLREAETVLEAELWGCGGWREREVGCA
jgi:hypothetical protein